MKAGSAVALLTPCMAAVSIALASCGGSDASTMVTNPEAGKVRIAVTGTTCTGNVLYEVGGAGNGPFGSDVSFPWTVSIDADPGDAVSLLACNTCVVAGCPSPPCDVTITTSIYWEGSLLTQNTGVGPADVTCTPSASTSTTIP
jgi:hypothetical protein